jgi:hypothetical protein
MTKQLSFEEFAGLARGGESRAYPKMAVNYILIEEDGEQVFYAEYLDESEDEAVKEAYESYLAGEVGYIDLHNYHYYRMAKQNGITVYNGKEYALTDQAEFCGIQNLRIDDSVSVLDSNNYSAPCIDKIGNEYVAYFEVINDEAELEDACDWENASYVVEAAI